MSNDAADIIATNISKEEREKFKKLTLEKANILFNGGGKGAQILVKYKNNPDRNVVIELNRDRED